MRAGAQKQLIQFMHQVQVSDGHGGSLSSPELYWSTWADINPMKQTRTLEAANMQLNGAWEIKVRYRPDRTPLKTMWVVYKGKKLTISSIVQDDFNRRGWLIVANERD